MTESFCRRLGAGGRWDLAPFFGPRLGEHHVGVRFHDHVRGRWKIYLDEEDVTDYCYEAIADLPTGRVILADRPTHRCMVCFDEPALIIRSGVVRLELAPAVAHGATEA